MNTRLKAPPVKLPADYEEEAKEKKPFIDRRRFMNYTGWLGVLGAINVALLGFLRFMFPRVLFEPPTEFKAGDPADYAVGVVDTRYVNSERVWIIREQDGFYALSAICTHLGCTPKYLGLRGQVQVPVPRERIPPLRHQLRGSGPEAAREAQDRPGRRRAVAHRQGQAVSPRERAMGRPGCFSLYLRAYMFDRCEYVGVFRCRV